MSPRQSGCPFFSASLLATGIFAVGCGGNVAFVEDGGEGGAGASSPNTTTSTTTSSPINSSSTTSGPNVGPAFIFQSAPNELTLRITTFGASCDAPNLETPINDCDWLDFKLTFPDDAFAVGVTLDGDSPVAYNGITEAGPADASGVCESGFWGGSLFGSLRFDSIDGSTTTLTLDGWGPPYLTDHEVAGTIVAANCFDIAR